MSEEAGNPYKPAPTSPAPPLSVKDGNIRYWSRIPGKFVNKFTGNESTLGKSVIANGPIFSGNIREWYESLVGVICDAAQVVEARTSVWPEILECSPEVLTILEHTVEYRPYHADLLGPKEKKKGASGEFVGKLNNWFHVHINHDLPAGTIKILAFQDERAHFADITVQVLDVNF